MDSTFRIFIFSPFIPLFFCAESFHSPQRSWEIIRFSKQRREKKLKATENAIMSHKESQNSKDFFFTILHLNIESLRRVEEFRELKLLKNFLQRFPLSVFHYSSITGEPQIITQKSDQRNIRARKDHVRLIKFMWNKFCIGARRSRKRKMVIDQNSILLLIRVNYWPSIDWKFFIFTTFQTNISQSIDSN